MVRQELSSFVMTRDNALTMYGLIVIRYEGLNCKGNSEVTVGMGDCAEVAGKWDSIEFTCEHFCL
jgi:hypothetical protein